MRPLEIVFTRSKKKLAIFSRLIMWYTNKKYSHVAVKFTVGPHEREMYFQSSEGKVNFEYKDSFSKKHEIIESYTVLISKELHKVILDKCLCESGIEYGYMQNLGIILVDLKLVENNLWKHGVVCSELIYDVVLKEMIPELDYNKNTIKPHEVEQIILDRFELIDGIWKLKE